MNIRPNWAVAVFGVIIIVVLVSVLFSRPWLTEPSYEEQMRKIGCYREDGVEIEDAQYLGKDLNIRDLPHARHPNEDLEAFPPFPDWSATTIGDTCWSGFAEVPGFGEHQVDTSQGR